jgi:hypothetical protein
LLIEESKPQEEDSKIVDTKYKYVKVVEEDPSEYEIMFQNAEGE